MDSGARFEFARHGRALTGEKMRKQIYGIIAAVCLSGIVAAGCSGKKQEKASSAQENMTTAASELQGNADVAGADETVAQQSVGTDDMTPVAGSELKDGVYTITVDSSSNMFHVKHCELTVKDGVMTADMTMGGTGYLKLFMGTGKEAAKASEEDMIPFEETEDGTHHFTVPVEALDQEVDCAAFSKKKEKWYDRVLVFRADSLPADALTNAAQVTAESLGLTDGDYTIEVSLEGGSGKATVESPAKLTVKDQKAVATIVWSSPNYDYMKVGDEKFLPVSQAGENSVFEIPVTVFDRKLAVAADTTAMSTPHEIEYTLQFDSSSIKADSDASFHEAPAFVWSEMKPVRSMKLSYANQFSIDYYDGGCALVRVQDDNTYLVIPEDAPLPKGIPTSVTVLQKPLDHVYLAATSAMDLIAALGRADRITLSGTKESGWYVEDAKKAMKKGTLSYAGKYSAPDYEKILSSGCDLALESTMIYHVPDVKTQLEQLKIPVFVERSSYEAHPLGRMEWIRLYGVLFDEEEKAEQLFKEQEAQLDTILKAQPTGKSAAFFYITTNGAVNVRKPGDYVAKMIELAGGSYVPQTAAADENALSTMSMQMETFYAQAKDADCLIYNSTIDGELQTLGELLQKSPLFADFKAVKNGNVWCTGKNMFQETMGLGNMIQDMHAVLSKEKPDDGELHYLHRLQ